MLITQLSVFAENQTGSLLEITGLLKKEGIDIRALALAESTDFGIVRLIVNTPEKAADAFTNAGIPYRRTDVIAAELDDAPGGLHRVLSTLSAAGISVEYTYAFLTPQGSKAYAILRVQDNAAAVKVLEAAGIPVLMDETLYHV